MKTKKIRKYSQEWRDEENRKSEEAAKRMAELEKECPIVIDRSPFYLPTEKWRGKTFDDLVFFFHMRPFEEGLRAAIDFLRPKDSTVTTAAIYRICPLRFPAYSCALFAIRTLDVILIWQREMAISISFATQ